MIRRVLHGLPVRVVLIASAIALGACDRPPRDLPPLLEAILARDAARVAAELGAGAAPGEMLRVPAEALTARGVEVEEGGVVTLTPLLLAAHVGDAGVVRLLLARGADPNRANADGLTPVFVAVVARHPEVVRLLAAAGARLDERTPEHGTALHAAVEERDFDVITALLQSGADAEITNPRGLTPMYMALSRGDGELIGLLQSLGVPLDARDPILADAVIDTAGHDPLREDDAPELLRRPLGIAVDAAAGYVYWTEYAVNRIRRIAVDSTVIETVLVDAGDGPIGIALVPEAGRMYWTGDGAFPRFVRTAALDGSERRTLALGPVLNRPRAITATPDTVFWTETVNGRVRRLPVAGYEVTDLFTDGISSRGDRPDFDPAYIHGIDVDNRDGWLYWSDFYGMAILRARPDGSGRERVHDAEDGVDSPVGIAVDEERGLLFWADVARAAILRAPLAGGAPEVVVDTAGGVIEPRDVAVDGQRGQLYWTDTGRDAIGRVRLDGGPVEWLPLRGGDIAGFAARRAPADCSEAVREAAADFVRGAVSRINVCLENLDASKAVKRRNEDTLRAEPTCRRQMSGLVPGGAGALDARLEALRAGACRAQRIAAADVLAGCHVAGSVCDAEACAIDACRARSWAIIGRRFLRAAEWLEELRPFFAMHRAAAGASPEAEAALRVLDEVYAAVAAAPPSPTDDVLPATGMQASYYAVRQGSPAWEAIPDDGATRAGAPLRFVDNGDGTVSDANTGLMWEKKCDGCGTVHGWRSRFAWSSDGSGPTIWEWLDQLNRVGGTGFAGYDDWRIPNVKELQSIIDYERFNPAVTRAFDGDRCGLGCSDLAEVACSCTALDAYWTSTTLDEDAGRAFAVSFNLGLVGDLPKSATAAVRAVRSGLPAAD